MKTILTIGGDRYLLPKQADVSKILDLLQGVTEVKSKRTYGPDGSLRYDDRFHMEREVLSERPTKFRVELVHDDDICTSAEFAKLESEIQERIAALPAEKPEAVARG